MNRRTFLIVLALILTVLNVFRWSGGSGARSGEEILAPDKAMEPIDKGGFFLPASPSEPELAMSRNLFLVATDVSPIAGAEERRLATKADPEIEHAKHMLESIRLVGILSQDRKKKAFVTYANESYMVSKGERIVRRFVVKSIRQESIRLFDPATGITKEIVLSGD